MAWLGLRSGLAVVISTCCHSLGRGGFWGVIHLRQLFLLEWTKSDRVEHFVRFAWGKSHLHVDNRQFSILRFWSTPAIPWYLDCQPLTLGRLDLLADHLSSSQGHLEYRMQRMHRMQRIWRYRDGGVRGAQHHRRQPPRYFSNQRSITCTNIVTGWQGSRRGAVQ